METWMIAVIVVVALAFVLAIAYISWYITTKNKFVRLQINTEESFSTMDVYMKKRHDLIPNIVGTVKGYATHEKETLSAVIEARNTAVTATGSEKMKAEGELTNFVSKLFALSENYPELKADRGFLDLQAELKSIETEIAHSRKFYNANVKAFNTYLRVFPSSIIANKMHLEKQEFFEIDDVQRQNVEVKF